MREIRLHGSEGGGTELNRSSLPLSKLLVLSEGVREGVGRGKGDWLRVIEVPVPFPGVGEKGDRHVAPLRASPPFRLRLTFSYTLSVYTEDRPPTTSFVVPGAIPSRSR